MTSIGTDVVGELQAQLSGRVLTAEDPDYDAVRAVFRGGFDGHPLAIARIANAHDIASVIRMVRQADLPLSVRSGGPSSSGASTNDGGLVIDVRDMATIDIDETDKTAWAGSGATALAMSQAAWD